MLPYLLRPPNTAAALPELRSNVGSKGAATLLRQGVTIGKLASKGKFALANELGISAEMAGKAIDQANAAMKGGGLKGMYKGL